MQLIRRSRRMTKSNRCHAWITAAFLLCLLVSLVEASTSSGTLSPPRSSSIPRSRRTPDDARPHAPLWNPSANIDAAGFLKGSYRRVPGEWETECPLRRTPNTVLTETNAVCQIRQVPGDGNCLFHSISLCLHHAVNGTHYDLSNTPVEPSKRHTDMQRDGTVPASPSPPLRMDDLYVQSRRLRAQAVACLRAERRRLYLQGREWMAAQELVEAAAQQYDLTPDEYCAAMEEEAVWGGGPEIVALCNLLQRPIHVYELASAPVDQFVLRRMACFGSPRFDHRAALHILSADSRFPDVRPGQQLAAGNHFLAVFPRHRRRGVLRGGDTATEGDDEEDGEDIWDGRPPFWQSRLPSHFERWRQRMERCFAPLGLTFWDGSCC
jgi:OTU-like cysteine protease